MSIGSDCRKSKSGSMRLEWLNHIGSRLVHLCTCFRCIVTLENVYNKWSDNEQRWGISVWFHGNARNQAKEGECRNWCQRGIRRSSKTRGLRKWLQDACRSSIKEIGQTHPFFPFEDSLHAVVYSIHHYFLHLKRKNPSHFAQIDLRSR